MTILIDNNGMTNMWDIIINMTMTILKYWTEILCNEDSNISES